MATVKHKFECLVPDDPDSILAGEVVPSNWNDDHDIILGADENFVTDAEKIVIGNTSGTNTGDQDLTGYSPTSHRHDGETIIPDVVAYDINPPVIPIAAGSTYYNATERTLSLVLDDGGSLEMGKEMFDHYTVLEVGGIVNGDIVSVVGASGNRSAVSLTDVAADLNSLATIGMCTVPTVANNNVGRITTRGHVHQLNTLGYTEGLPVYVHPTNKGKWTQTKPAAPVRAIQIGVVVVAHSTEGVIDVDVRIYPKVSELCDVNTTLSKTTPVDADVLLIQDSADSSIWKKITWSNLKATLTGWISTLFSDTKEPTGFNNLSRLAADQAATVSMSGSTLSVTPVSPRTAFDIYYRGTKITKTGVQTLLLSSYEATVPNKVYVYYSSNGTLSAGTSPWNISKADTIPVAIAYWNGTVWRVGNETHGITMDADTHSYLHFENGSSYEDGFDLTVSTTGDDTVDIGDGYFKDEDKWLYHNSTATAVYDLWYRYPLSSPTKMTFIDLGIANDRPYYQITDIPQYDDGAAFVNVPDNAYFNCWIIATHIANPAQADDLLFASICPQEVYVNISNARAEQWSNLDIEDRWIDEMCKLYRVTFQRVGSAVNYIEHLDVRGQKIESQSTLQVEDVIIAGLTGNVGGNSGSVETYLENLDAALTSVSYYVSAATVTDGTAVGTIANTQTDDGTYYQVTEESGNTYAVGPIDVQLAIGNGLITPTTLPTSLTIKFIYTGATVGHSVQLQVYRYGTTNAWQNMGAAISSAASFATYQFTLADYVGGIANLAELVSGGNILIRALHTAVNGVNTHYIRFDYVVAQKQISAAVDPTTIISQVITNGVTNKAPSEDAVFDALALKVNTTDSRVVETRTDLTPSAGAAGTITLDLSLGRSFKIDCSTNSPTSLTVALSNVPAGTNMTALSLLLKTGAGALPTVTWPTGVTAPTLAISKTAWFTLATEDNGTTIRIFAAGSF